MAIVIRIMIPRIALPHGVLKFEALISNPFSSYFGL